MVGRAGVVVNLGNVHFADCDLKIGHAPVISAPHIRIWNEVSPALRPRAYTHDVFLGSIKRDEDQMSLVTSRAGVVDQSKARMARESCLYSEAFALREIFLMSLNTSLPAANATLCGSEGFISRATASGLTRSPRPRSSTNSVSIDLPDPFGPAINVRVGNVGYAAAAVNSRTIS